MTDAVRDDAESDPRSDCAGGHCAAALDVESNEVLQFLLGNTHSIASDDASSITSTSSSQAFAVFDQIQEDSCQGEMNARVEWSERPTGREHKTPELGPFSETDSDSDAHSLRKPSAPRCRPNVLVDLPRGAPTESLAQINGFDKALGGWELSALNQRMVDCKPELQPEDDVASSQTDSVQLRRRKRSTVAQAQRTSDKPSVNPPQAMDASSRSAQLDLLFNATIVGILLAYCVAIMYRSSHPIRYPIPNVDALFKPWDVSNVTARFISPMLTTETRGALTVEWEIANFPADALREHGVEPFDFRVLLDGGQIVFDLGILSVESDEDEVINKIIRYRVRPDEIPGYGTHTLHLEVRFPIPGSDDELQTLTDETSFTFLAPLSSAPLLTITSPRDGTVFSVGDSIIVEYEAHNVHKLDVVLDRRWRLTKSLLSDGNLMLRGLGAGVHTIWLEAFGDDGALVAANEISVELQQQQSPRGDDAASVGKPN